MRSQVMGRTRRFYCIYGDALNTACRVGAAAEPGEVVCSKAFATRLEARATLGPSSVIPGAFSQPFCLS